MRATAGVQIEIANVDETQLLAHCRRNLANPHASRFLGSSETNLQRTIFGDDLVGQPLGGFQLFWVEGIGGEIDGAEVIAHVERDSGEAVEPFEGGGEHMLPRMLLHVVTAASGIDFATNRYPRPQPTGRAVNKVQDLAGVEVLSAAGGIES